jgi:hypothetical protein
LVRWIFGKCRHIKPYFKGVDQYDDMWNSLSGWTEQDYTCRRMPANTASGRFMARCFGTGFEVTALGSWLDVAHTQLTDDTR